MNTWSYTSFHNFGPNNQTRLNHQQLINFAVTGFNQFANSSPHIIYDLSQPAPGHL